MQLALFVIFHALLREREEVAFQRRWYFFLGVGVSTLLNLYRAQRFGLLLHGSSYYLEHAPQLKLSRRFRNILFTRNKHLSEEGLTKSFKGFNMHTKPRFRRDNILGDSGFFPGFQRGVWGFRFLQKRTATRYVLCSPSQQR